jgi:hypothetical protein
VADVAAHLATDAEAVDAGVEIAVADEDAFGGAGDAPGVLVAAGFDGDAVVAGAESAAFDENIGAGVGVAAVVVVVEAFDGDAADDDVAAEGRVENPEGRVKVAGGRRVRLTRRGPPVRASGPEAEFVIVNPSFAWVTGNPHKT